MTVFLCCLLCLFGGTNLITHLHIAFSIEINEISHFWKATVNNIRRFAAKNNDTCANLLHVDALHLQIQHCLNSLYINVNQW